MLVAAAAACRPDRTAQQNTESPQGLFVFLRLTGVTHRREYYSPARGGERHDPHAERRRRRPSGL